MYHSKQISDFLNFLKEAETAYNNALDDKAKADVKTQDILHRLELEEDNYHNTARLAKGLRKVRQERRKAKDAISLFEPIIKWIHNNDRSIQLLRQLLGEVRKAERQTQNRQYIYRTSIVDDVLNCRNE